MIKSTVQLLLSLWNKKKNIPLPTGKSVKFNYATLIHFTKSSLIWVQDQLSSVAGKTRLDVFRLKCHKIKRQDANQLHFLKLYWWWQTKTISGLVVFLPWQTCYDHSNLSFISVKYSHQKPLTLTRRQAAVFGSCDTRSPGRVYFNISFLIENVNGERNRWGNNKRRKK